mmetsp:Transcript_3803/g.3908  ORF Transcript_3803/g.3908 Transcript_3803/m.3908 type:complete len:99 (+) Transcript_3803:78-374(+)
MADSGTEVLPFKKNCESPFAYNVLVEQHAREYQVAIETKNIIRDKLAHCFRTEGVNHVVNCKELRETYFSLCTDRFRGMLFAEGHEPASRGIPGLVKK